jgi:mRNA-degrading endonuclease toxin of MazEF toxin-antitoxin module
MVPAHPAPIDIYQGELFWIDIPARHTEGSEQHGRRPFVVMSRLNVNRRLKTVVVVPLTTFGDQTLDAAFLASQPPYRVVVPVNEITKDVGCTSNLSNCVAKTDQARVVDKTRLLQKIGKLSQTATISVGLGLAYLFDIR